MLIQRNSSSDDWYQCANGHYHWGLNGAAGVFLRHVDDQNRERYFLQQRGPYVQHPGTWSTPGGAIMDRETPETAALRESQEEFGGPIPIYQLQNTHTFNCGGWPYHTFIADVPSPFYPTQPNRETADSGWFTPPEIDELPLHSGFRTTWDEIKPNKQPDPHREIWSNTISYPWDIWSDPELCTEPTEVMNPDDHWPDWGERPPDSPKHIDTDYGWAHRRN